MGDAAGVVADRDRATEAGETERPGAFGARPEQEPGDPGDGRRQRQREAEQQRADKRADGADHGTSERRVGQRRGGGPPERAAGAGSPGAPASGRLR